MTRTHVNTFSHLISEVIRIFSSRLTPIEIFTADAKVNKHGINEVINVRRTANEMRMHFDLIIHYCGKGPAVKQRVLFRLL